MNGSPRAFGLDLEEQWWTDLQGLLGLILKNGWMCGFVDVVDPKGRWGLILDERMMNDGAFFKGRRGLILNWWMVDPRAVGAWSWKNDERRTKNTFFKGRRGLILNWWMIVDPKGRWGLILEERWTKNEERRELSWFFGNLDAWELRSFRASELQEFCLMIFGSLKWMK